MQAIEIKIDKWKKRLLDLGKRNRLINFKETKRSNIVITSPNYHVLYKKLVQDEEVLRFPFPQKTTFDEDGEEQNIAIQRGDIETNKTLNEQQKTLKVLRGRAKTSIEEQGINSLYLTFGIIRWKENDVSDVIISSPIILVPVTIYIESITEPYTLKLHEDEIVVNPSLAFKFENDFGIILPDFDGSEDDIATYLTEIKKLGQKNNWEISSEVNLTLLSFLKINMYKDLENNKDKIVSNPIIKSLSGDKSEIPMIPDELNNFDHDENTRPIDTYQVVDADSSQQDAILLSKKGMSFVLQGPPGTGKSQTITNIIAEAISDGKKVLFVSEKMAALEVVKKRLTGAGLDDFCLTLHSYKANKKEILNQLSKTLNVKRISLREDAIYKLSVLEERRRILNEYQTQLHQKCTPLNISIYEAYGRLAKLYTTQDIIFEIKNIECTDIELLNKYRYLLSELSKTIGKMSTDYIENPWYGCNVPAVTYELRHDIEVNLNKLSTKLYDFIQTFESVIEKTRADITPTIKNIASLVSLLDFSSKSTTFPLKWLDEDITSLVSVAQEYLKIFNEYTENRSNLLERYSESILNLNANDIISTIQSQMADVKIYLDNTTFESDKEIVLKADNILNECEDLKTFLQNISDQSKAISSIIDVEHHNSFNSIFKIDKLIELVIKNPQPVENWFNYDGNQHIFKLLEVAKNEQRILNDNFKNVMVNYRQDVLCIDSNSLLEKFISAYSNTLKVISQYNNLQNTAEVTNEIVTSFVLNQVELIKSFYHMVTKAFEVSNQLKDGLGIKSSGTLSGLVSLGGLLSAAIQNPKPTSAWFDENKDSAIDKIILEIKSTQEEIAKETYEISIKYDKDIFNIDYKSMLIKFKTDYNSFSKYLKPSYYSNQKTIKHNSKQPNIKLSDHDIVALLNKISNIREKEQWLLDNKHLATEVLGCLYTENYTNWEIVEKCRVYFKVIKEYFGVSKIPEEFKKLLIDSDIEQLITPHSIINNIVECNISDFIEGTFGAMLNKSPISELLNEMHNTISTSIEVKNDIEMIASYAININDIEKISISSILELLTSIKEVSIRRKWYNNNHENLLKNFGKHYKGEDTDWQEIESRIHFTEQIKEYFGKSHVPKKLVDYLVTSENAQEDFIFLKNLIGDISKEGIISRLNRLLNFEDVQIIDFNKMISILSLVGNGVNISYSKYIDFSTCAKNSSQYEKVMSDIVLLRSIQETEEIIVNHSPELQSKFVYMFDGLKTCWDKTILALDYANKFKDLNKQYSFATEFTAEVSKNSSSEYLIKYYEKLIKQESDIKIEFDWFVRLFDTGKDFYGTNVYTLLDKAKECNSNLSLLEEWIDFRSIRQQCKEIGLSEFVDKVESAGIKSDVIVDTFFKRFYRLWLDIFLQSHPAVNNFRGRSHHSIIDEFNNLDKSQLEIARLRILERLIARLPNTNIATSSVDEVGILKRELSKQRKIMPLRKLFNTIPNLLTALKPCLMMSPLSVSLFLQADGYCFDTVIFDEASQVCTEDAIGAIMRGKQVIIAGDSNQLPPTSFFATSLADGDFDSEDDEEFDDTGAFDSILEEAVNAIPERTLKWHYRSRHEHLIAFSNAKIYNHQLITFPSSIDKINDNGVEYILVEDGVYDRGGKKHNLKEAKCVAEAVFEHIRKYPSRSLGVVSFSEAQQQAVDSAIRQLRLQNSSYEQFFSEDAEDAFFIKNLENVQGDERDTIIFSIGYAKDPNGVMYMNFGPLSRNGGHRRLNVAITRAKYNVKLVGSIHPTDIKIENTSSEGVKMLRQYIEYAINGTAVLQNELQFTNSINLESPFEESVYDFLIKNGFNVTTQVGCSGYRIDMAVKHPTLNGIFVLGIECDGATYHSARTARERDRLRQTVLEDIGWTIYRIWSTDWIKDPKTEGKKLLEAVNMSIANYKMDNLSTGSKNRDELSCIDTDSSTPMYVTTEVVKASCGSDNNPYEFDYYNESDVYKVPRAHDDTQYLANVVNYVVEKECPIHFELLCKRVAPIFGNQKATSKVRSSVEYVLNKTLKNVVITKNDFCWHENIPVIKVRIPPIYGEGRPINYICIEELAEAMFIIAGKSFGITKNDLYVVTARAFGFNRTGGNILQAMERACSYLIESGIVKEVDGKIVW